MTDDKRIGGFNLFTLWFGAAVSIAEIMTGSLISPLGLKKGIGIILLGHLIGTLILSVVGIIGFKERKPSLVSSRVSLGKYGSYIISVLNVIQLIGWTAIMLIQCARSIQPIAGRLLGVSNFTAIVIITGALVALWALCTDGGIGIINDIAVMLLLILSFVMLWSITGAGHIKQVSGSMTFGGALELSIVMPLTWVPLISDYTMRGKSTAGSFWGSFAGYFLGSSLMYIIGLAASVYTGSADIAAILTSLNMGYSALYVVILSTVTTTFLDVYSGVMSALNMVPSLSKRKLIVVFAGLGTLLALYFPMEQYENFLYMIGSLFAPVFTVVIADYFIFKDDRSNSMLNIYGILASAVGVAAYYMMVEKDMSIGSTVPSMMVTMGVYITLRLIGGMVHRGLPYNRDLEK